MPKYNHRGLKQKYLDAKLQHRHVVNSDINFSTECSQLLIRSGAARLLSFLSAQTLDKHSLGRDAKTT
jgi:hypothetical protein